mmetsp:Transcript_2386/g.4792  ORF Transcript_2386/g.4792 Transcript_2386/m.4792 type:complete len:208 (+) Transcript_2386:444-1067(+)
MLVELCCLSALHFAVLSLEGGACSHLQGALLWPQDCLWFSWLPQAPRVERELVSDERPDALEAQRRLLLARAEVGGGEGGADLRCQCEEVLQHAPAKTQNQRGGNHSTASTGTRGMVRSRSNQSSAKSSNSEGPGDVDTHRHRRSAGVVPMQQNKARGNATAMETSQGVGRKGEAGVPVLKAAGRIARCVEGRDGRPAEAREDQGYC